MKDRAVGKMLHIILLLFKIIGLLLLGIIVLFLILLATVILTPLTYSAELSADNSIESLDGKVSFYWLFHLLEGYLNYKDGKFEWRIRAAWKQFGNTEYSKIFSAQSEDKPKSQESEHNSAISVSNESETAVSSNKTETEIYREYNNKENIPGKSWENKGNDEKKRPAQKRKKFVEKKKLSAEKGRISEKLQKFGEKIKYTFRKFCDKIKTLKKKKERITAFLESTVHKNAFSRLTREVRRLLRFLRPSRASVALEFGFTDPAYTGYTLAWISMIYPMIGEFTQLKPDFEHKVFRGNISLKGKFRIVYALIFVWNMAWDKNVRITYRDIRKFRL